jgi:hypothetical protein
MTRLGTYTALLVAALSLACAHAAVDPEERAGARALAEPPAPIRDFDLATIEKLGKAIYAQDKLAWIATDVLYAHRSEEATADEGIRGWITGTLDGHDRVRFIRIGEDGPEALYDVTFAGDGPPQFASPASRTLLPEERAQYDARMLALDDIPARCSDRYNTVALRDPESDAWLVWALAATLEPDVTLIGGHYRFTISPDGSEIRRRDALSTSCLRFEDDGSAAGQFMSHVVSLTPLETHSFASLNYRRVLHVGTMDGTAWRVAEGRIMRVEQDAPDLDGFAARALAAIDETCVFITSSDDGPSKTYGYTTTVTKVIEVTERDGPFAAQDPPAEPIEMIACVRKDIVPSPNDYEVPAAGYELMIADRGQGHPRRTGKLTLADGKFAFALIEGEPLTQELEKRLAARLDRFQRAMERRAD